MLLTEILQSSPPISIPRPGSDETVSVAAAMAALVTEAVIDIAMVDSVEEAVAVGIDVPFIEFMLGGLK